MSDTNVESQLRVANSELNRRIALLEETLLEKERTEAALQVSETCCRRLFESARDGILILDADTGAVVEVNSFLLELLGYTFDELRGKYIWEIGLFKDIASSREAFKNLQDKEYLRYEDLPLETHDGQSVDVEFVGNVCLVNGSRVIQCSIRDITERKQLEQKAKVAALIDSSDDAVIGKTLDGNITSWNRGAEKIYGYAESEILGKPISILLPPGLEDEVPQILEKIKSGEHVENYETVRRRKDGRDIWMSLTVSPVRNDEGRIVAASTIGRDITERKQADEASREGGKRYKQLLESVTDYIYTVRVQDNLPLATVHGPGCAAVTGYTSKDYEADPYLWYRMVYEQDRDAVMDQAARILSGEKVSPLEHRIIHRDGSIRWVRNTPVRHYDEQRKLIAYDGMITNITDRKQAEEALRESEARLKIAMDLAKLVQWEYDVKSATFSFDDQFYALYGTTSRQEGGMLMTADAYVRKFIPPEESHVIAGEIAKALASADPHFTDQFEHRIVRADGEERHIVVRILVVCDRTGEVVKIRGATQDITERKRAEGALRENQSRLDLTLRSAHMGVWHLDLIENKRHFDEQVCHLLGIDPAKFTGAAEEFYQAVHPDDRDAIAAALARSIEQDALYETEYRVVWPDKSLHYIITRGNLFRDETGQPVRMNGLVWDITDRKRAEEEKEMLEARLRQAQKLEAIGTLAGGIAHDFNNLLQPMMGYTEMALNELSPSSPLRDGLEQVLNASIRAKELVRQILAISRSTREQQRIPIDISSIVKEALKLLRSSLPTSIEMRQKIRKGIALADPTQIHQVLMNLCTNAAHAMAGKGVLEVRLSPVDLNESDLADQSIVDLKPGPHLRLTVSDTGCGIDAGTMERIFDPYFTTKEVGKGSGLGLAVVQGIVKRHDGAVTVRSELGKGTTFSVYIPKVDVQPEATMQVDDPLKRGSERILLVDDEPAVMEMGTRLLEHLGYRVTSQTDSVSALEVFRLSPDEFDLVITDYTMPKLTGLDLAREVLRIRPDIPILLCTGFSEKITPDHMKELGMGLLMKPYGMRQISEEVRKILDARKGGWFEKGNQKGPGR